MAPATVPMDYKPATTVEVTAHMALLSESTEVGVVEDICNCLETILLPWETSSSTDTILAQFCNCGSIDPKCILLDSGSSIHHFTDGFLLHNICCAPNGRHITVTTSSKSVTVNQISDLSGSRVVWYHPQGITNVLSPGLISSKFCITMDTSIDNTLTIHRTDGSIHRFAFSETGLYHSNVTDYFGTVLTTSTAKSQKTKYSALGVQRATTTAWQLEVIIGKPTTKDFLHITVANLLKDCGTT